MKEHSIILSSSMVRAVLNGSKTQSRKVIPTPPYEVSMCGSSVRVTRPRNFSDEYCRFHPAECPYGEKGDRLWVREKFRFTDFTHETGLGKIEYSDGTKVEKDFTGVTPQTLGMWKPSTQMKREFSRILLEITRVRVGKLKDISIADIEKEGFSFEEEGMDAELFEIYWDYAHKNTAHKWSSNPWVWVVDFKMLRDT